MTKNTLNDLNDILFKQLERLSDESMSEDELQKEIQRSGAVTDTAEKVITNASLILKANVAYGNVYSSNPKDKSELLLGHEVHKATD